MYDDQEFVEQYYNGKKELFKTHPLRVLFFEITSRCNARCEHCGSSCGDFVPKDEITGEEIKKVLRDVAAHYDPKLVMLNITGGEPLVRKDLFELMDYATKLGFYWGMTTNGMLIDEEVVKKIVDTKMYSISVSIDGMKELHESFRKVPGSFEKIIHGLKLMKECPSIGVLQVTTCVNKKNIDQLEDIYQLLKELGIKYWRIMEVDPIGRAKNNDDLLLDADGENKMFEFMKEKQLTQNEIRIDYGCAHYLGWNRDWLIRGKPFICGAGTMVGSVLSNGDIFVCPDVPRRPELIQGNVRKDSFVEVWEKKFKPYRKVSRTTNSTCKKCPDWKICMGGAFHTWDFDENRQLFCAREKFKEMYEFEKRVLENQKKNKKKDTKKKETKKSNKKTSS